MGCSPPLSLIHILSFKYQATGTGDDVLSHISFSIEPGKFLAIVGGTGTGDVYKRQDMIKIQLKKKSKKKFFSAFKGARKHD